MEGKTNFSRRLAQFDGLTRLTLTLSLFYDRSTCATGICCHLLARTGCSAAE